MKSLFLLDAYALIYRAYYGFIYRPLTNSKGWVTSAIYGFSKTLQEILDGQQIAGYPGTFKPDMIAICFDPKGGSFRHHEFPSYKAQRDATPEDIVFAIPWIKKIIEAYRIPTIEVPNYEADDVVGTLARLADESGLYETFMMTPDKDYAQLVTPTARIFKPKSFGPGYEMLDEAGVLKKYGLKRCDQMIDMLGLQGDSSDNIMGCPGIGPKIAQYLISEFDNIENLLEHVEAAVAQGQTELPNIKAKIFSKIVENMQSIRDSKYLATICRTVPGVTIDEEALTIHTPDYDKLYELYTELEFRKMAEDIRKKRKANSKDNSIKNSSIKKDTVTKTKTTSKNKPLAEGEIPLEFDEEDTKMKSGSKTKVKSAGTTTKKSHAKVEEASLFDVQEDDIVVMDTMEKVQDLIDQMTWISEWAFEVNDTDIRFATTPENTFSVPLSDPMNIKLLQPLFDGPALKIGYDIKHHYKVLHGMGITLSEPWFDTMVAQYLLDPDLHYTTAACAENLDLAQNYRMLIKDRGLNRLCYDVEMPMVRVLADMEMAGIRVDVAALTESRDILMTEMTRLENRLTELAGHPFNPSSPKAVAELIFDELNLDPRGKNRSTAEDNLILIKSKLNNTQHIELIDSILSYRGIRKLLSTYIDALPTFINPKTGRIHCQFNQTVTATGRLSSSNPNLQNIPIRESMGRELRKAFVPDEGEVFFSADYSQVELRLMAHLSGDQNMIAAFNEGDDIHAATAAKIYHKTLEEVTKEERSKAKTANFGIIYGISVFGLASRLNIPRAEAKELINGYFETYPGVKTYMDKCVQTARDLGYAETLFGRRRFLKDIHSANATVRSFAERNAINAPIQGSAADIIKVAMVNITRRIKREKLHAKLLIQVHDELNFTVPTSEIENLQQIVLEEMQGVMKLAVPLIADCGSGVNWLEAH